MDKFDYVIVGAGFAGATCAERLAAAGKTVLIIDKRDHVGGNAYDEFNEHGILVHRYGSHIFHTNSTDVYSYVSRFTSWRPYEHRVLAFESGRLVPMPINWTTLAAFGGDMTAAREALILPYTRKQWGLEPDALSPEVLGRIKARDSDDDRYFLDRYQGIPKDGYSALFRRMLAHPNIKVMLKTSYQDVQDALGEVLGGIYAEYGYAKVIYTGPIDEFFDYRLGRLPYRSASFEFVTRPQWSMDGSVGVVNYPEAQYDYTRVHEFRVLTGQMHDHTTIAFEVPRADGDPYWPVPTPASAALRRDYQALAREEAGVYFCGRLGSFMYLDMDQAIAQALKLARRLVEGGTDGDTDS